MGNCASCETKAEKTARQKKKDGKQPEQGSGAVVGGPSSPDVIDLGQVPPSRTTGRANTQDS